LRAIPLNSGLNIFGLNIYLMATLKFLKFKDGITATFSITEKEYDLLKQSEDSVVILPAGAGVLNETLTTGRLGNGNRIMLPAKILRAHNVEELIKKAPSRIFELDDSIFLLIKLEDNRPGVPVFGEG
jgi:hypothetical protein